MGYTLDVESRVGAGTSFTIDLAPAVPPAADDDAAHPRQRA
jgi:hypothetical protein